MSSDPRTIALACHPETPDGAVRDITVHVVREPEGSLALTYVLSGSIARLRVPAPREPRAADRLWERTCCEIFIARSGVSAYHEVNLSPSGEWAMYAFARYRERLPQTRAAQPLDPRIAVRAAGSTLELDAEIRLDRLSPAHCSAPLSLALSAVVEDQDGSLSYWALRHPAGKPDFHHADAFALELA